MRWVAKAERKDALVATVSPRALKRRLPAVASLAHEGMSPQRNGVSARERVPVSSVRRARTPSTWSVGATFQLGCGSVLDSVAQGGLEIVGQAGRWGDEGEASTHEDCIVT